jgi:single-strand selective monofunctional uracil DNA glycosylase
VSEDTLQAIVHDLVRDLRDLHFGSPVTHVYDPLEYAREPHLEYLRRFGAAPKRVLMLGMNPGPWGMAQTGVPFGEISMVRDWMGIEGEVERPEPEHPKRPIEGFDCTRGEVSGGRLWGWAKERFGAPERFFERFFVWNYCPLVFMEESGRNRTPDKLPKEESGPLFATCDQALARVVGVLEPELTVGVGRFAESRLQSVLEGGAPASGRVPRIGAILHPSPASPAANRGWAEKAEAQLRHLGVEIP